MPALTEKLKKLGLHKNEISVYLRLLTLGQCRAGAIIEQTKLHRNLVYMALEELVAKKLASKMEKGKVAVFEANDPKALKEIIAETMETADAAINELRALMVGKPRDVKIFDGIEGVKATRDAVAREILPKEKYYVMGVSYSNSSVELNNYFHKFNRNIIAKGGDLKVLAAGEESKQMLTDRALTLGENARYLPFNVESPMWITMFRDILNISIVGADPITFSIRSAEAAKGFKQYFEYFWEQPVRVESGMKAVEMAIYNMLGELRRGEEYFVLGAAVGMSRGGEIGKMYDQFHADRIKKGVTVNMLANLDNYAEIVERNHKFGDPQETISHIKKFISAPPTPMQVNMYGDKCFFILYGESPAVIYFERPEIAKVFKNYFDYFWNQDTYILRGPEVIRDLWLESVKFGELRYIGARGYFIDKYPQMWAQVKAKTELAKNYQIKNIVDPGVRGHAITKLPYAQTKYLLSATKNPNVVWLYGSKVAVSNWTESEPVVFVSENKALVQSYNDYFDELWNKGGSLPKQK